MAADRERRCAASGEVKGEAELIRLALAPDDNLVPDLSAKLPGRGIWITADRDAVELALKKGLFSRAAKTSVTAPDDLADRLEHLLEQRALNLLGLARRAGDLAVGFDAVQVALRKGHPAWRIEASDGAADGRRKLDGLTRSVWDEDMPVAGCFLAEQLGAALGRGPVVHALLDEGPQARSFDVVIRKLAGFRALDPGARKGSRGEA
ncbi:RNA-binding protein [Maricaulis sp. D1M11]|uniref:RNA-binding protein n=1 Tax=Maricaulis sp. D1M11 TaxID=3076117 RepID=UPI0039B6D6D6